MSLSNALWVVFFCLSFIGITMWAFSDMEGQIEDRYEVIIQKINNQKDSVQNLLDSVQSETFRMDIDLNRYEVAFEIFARRNPNCAEQYANIISEETE